VADDSQFLKNNFQISEREHCYGSNVHLLDNLYTQTILTQLCEPKVIQPRLNKLVSICYQELLRVAVNDLFDSELVKKDTRMIEFTKEGYFKGLNIDQKTSAVVVDLARAGTWPSHQCFEDLSYLIDPSLVRQDHFYINRSVNENGQVDGVDVSGSKIGGGQDNSYVFFPDPMGATGGSISHCVRHYKEKVEGTAKQYIALHLIVTPEYIERMSKDHPDVKIYALRLDRGLSSEEALKSIPGKLKDQERGLTDNQYIVPGAGGVGEVLNNSFV
jgi:uracil phosphoribosyltransferase